MAGAWKAGGRAEGPPQESRELPAKKAEALLTLMSRPFYLLCPTSTWTWRGWPRASVQRLKFQEQLFGA